MPAHVFKVATNPGFQDVRVQPGTQDAKECPCEEHSSQYLEHAAPNLNVDEKSVPAGNAAASISGLWLSGSPTTTTLGSLRANRAQALMPFGPTLWVHP